MVMPNDSIRSSCRQSHMARQPSMLIYDAAESEDHQSDNQIGRQATRALNQKRDIALSIERAKQRLPKDGFGEPYKHFGLVASVQAVRTLGSDAAFYVRFIQEGTLVAVGVLILLMPAMSYNSGGGPYTNWTTEYAPFVERGVLSGTDPDVDVWTVAWPGCGNLGVGANLKWGRSGGNFELAGASRLSFVQVGCDSFLPPLVCPPHLTARGDTCRRYDGGLLL